MKCEGCPSNFTSEFPPCFSKYPGGRSQRNPGNIVEFHYLAHRVKPTLLDGIEFNYTHRLSDKKTIISNLILSHNKPSGLRFGGVYNAHIQGDVVKTPIIQADINPSTLSTNIGFLYYPFRCLKLEANLQRAAENLPLQTQTSIELSTNSSTLTANFYDLSSDRGRATLSFLRSVSAHLCLGSELLLEWTEPNTLTADTALAARYERYSYSVAATASRQGIDISYWQRIHPRLQLASLWAWNRKTSQSVGTICYQWDFKDVRVRGMLDSNLSLGFMYSRYLTQVPFSMDFSLFINLLTNRFVFGLKFVLDPCGLQRGE